MVQRGGDEASKCTGELVVHALLADAAAPENPGAPGGPASP